MATSSMATPAMDGPTTGQTNPPIALQIGHLVVEGVQVGDPEAFRAALEQELARQLNDDPQALDGLRDTAVAQLAAPRLGQAGLGASAAEVARSLIQGLGRSSGLSRSTGGHTTKEPR